MRIGRLHAVIDERGVHRFARSEVLELARKRAVPVGDVHAQLAARVFKYFEDGYKLAQIVIDTGQHPSTIRELYAEYLRPLDGESPSAHALRLAKEQEEHDKRQRQAERELRRKQRREVMR